MILRHLSLVALLGAFLLTGGGCVVAQLVSNAAYAAEREKKIQVLPEYTGLENETVAVVVQADMATLYEHPMVMPNLAANIAARLQSNVPGIQVRDARDVLTWQYHTPGWTAMPYGEIARQLGVQRVVYVDLYEFRLHPLGNRWVWQGVCAANVGIIERDGIDPDAFSESFNVAVKFPPVEGLGVDSASAQQIETGLLVKFIEKSAWLFYEHIEDKYPDA